MPTWMGSIYFRRTEVRFMLWWRWLVIDYSQKSFDNGRNQVLTFRWAVMSWHIHQLCVTLNSTASRFVVFPIDMKTNSKFVFSLWYKYLFTRKNNSSLILLVNSCGLSYCISSKYVNSSCLNHRVTTKEGVTWHLVSTMASRNTTLLNMVD